MIYHIEVAGPNLDLIGKALSALPYAQVSELMKDLQRQAIEQEAIAKANAEIERKGPVAWSDSEPTNMEKDAA